MQSTLKCILLISALISSRDSQRNYWDCFVTMGPSVWQFHFINNNGKGEYKNEYEMDRSKRLINHSRHRCRLWRRLAIAASDWLLSNGWANESLGQPPQTGECIWKTYTDASPMGQIYPGPHKRLYMCLTRCCDAACSSYNIQYTIWWWCTARLSLPVYTYIYLIYILYICICIACTCKRES